MARYIGAKKREEREAETVWERRKYSFVGKGGKTIIFSQKKTEIQLMGTEKGKKMALKHGFLIYVSKTKTTLARDPKARQR